MTTLKDEIRDVVINTLPFSEDTRLADEITEKVCELVADRLTKFINREIWE